MKKIEFVWRELLERVIEKRNPTFTISELAKKFSLSSSVVYHALTPLRELNIIQVGKFSSQVTDWERLLFFWATKRSLKKDIIYQTFSNQSAFDREGLMPAAIIPTAYTAFRLRFKKTPADYDHVYFYSLDLAEVKRRFPPKKDSPNIFILKPDSFLAKRKKISLGQLFVDLWNLPEWYAKEFQDECLKEIKNIFNL